MSLQIWLPLNGNSNNQGLFDTTFSLSNLTYADGKFGKSLATGSIGINATQANQIFNSYNQSICFWYFNNTAESSTTSSHVITGQSNVEKRQYSLFAHPNSDDLHYSMFGYLNTDNIGNIKTGGVINDVLPCKKWTHVCLTNDNGKICIYINSTIKKDFTVSNFIFDFSKYDYPLIQNSPYHLIQDFRVYDHTLSLKEVHEIYKGLIFHYPLNSPYTEPVVNLYGRKYEAGEGGGNINRISKIDEEGISYTNYSFTKSPDTTNSWRSINFDNYQFTADKTYTISMDVRVNNCSSNVLMLRHARLNNDYFGCKTVNVVTSSLVGKGWKHYSLTQIIPKSFVYNSQTKTCKPLIELYTGNLAVSDGATTICSMNFDIKNVQVIEKDHDLPFSTETNTIVDDCSGFGNNGVVDLSTTPSWDANSIRYRGCYKFSGNQFLTTGKGVKVTDAITVSVWGYMDTWNGNGRIVSCTESGGWNFESNGGYVSFPLYVSTVGYIEARSTTYWTSLANGWHHFSGTYDGLNSKLYIDGKMMVSVGTGKTNALPIAYNANNTIFVGAEAGNNSTTPAGNYFNGKISDLRIYCTALSDNDIASLYKVSASITDNGTLMLAGEVIEE